jgi:hypothetical protein
MAGAAGFEPTIADPKSAALPLGHAPPTLDCMAWLDKRSIFAATAGGIEYEPDHDRDDKPDERGKGEHQCARHMLGETPDDRAEREKSDGTKGRAQSI